MYDQLNESIEQPITPVGELTLLQFDIPMELKCLERIINSESDDPYRIAESSITSLRF